MQTLPYMFAALAVGAMISAQPFMNAMLARAIGNPFGAATISIAVALLACIALFLFTGYGNITADGLITLPWWVYLAGLAGTVFVAGGVLITPVTGALIFFYCVIAGQLISSTAADHFGAFRLEVRKVSLARLAGVFLVLGGSVLVSQG